MRQLMVEVPSFYEPRRQYHHYYVLFGRTPVPAPFEIYIRLQAQEKTKRIVRQETVRGAFVSTVFLGLNHAWGPGPPMIFETMIFWHDERCEHQTRCSTWEEAEIEHRIAVAVAMIENTKWRRIKTVAYRLWNYRIWRQWQRIKNYIGRNENRKQIRVVSKKASERT